MIVIAPRRPRLPKIRLKPHHIAILFLLGLLLVYMRCIEPGWLVTRHLDYRHPDIPREFNDVKIVFISDVHHGPYYSREQVRALVDRVNALTPDMIILGGDNVYLSPAYIRPCFEELGRIKARLGKYGVLGNHDHMESASLTRAAMGQAGFVLLDNRGFWIEKGNGRIRLGGVGDLWKDKQSLGPTIDPAAAQDFVILVSHNPDYAEQIKTNKVDLVLSGHTHGGQATFFGLWAPHTGSRYGQKYRTGMVKTPYTTVYVSNGEGIVWPPIRFFARPEITEIRLQSTRVP